MIPEIFFAVSVWGALHTLAALVRLKRPKTLGLPFMLMGMITGEMALFHLSWQVVATAIWIAVGALGETIGIIGLAITVLSWVGLVLVHRRSLRVGETLQPALAAIGVEIDDYEPSREVLRRPFRPRFDQTEITRNITYGERGSRNCLDLYVPRHLSPNPAGAPVILQIHGGAWVTGQKEQQGQPLLDHMTSRGWIGAAINYPLGPKVRFPDPIIDVKRAIAWVRTNIAERGGDPRLLVVTGGSAGGHLTALAALTPDRLDWQPGFEEIDTSVTAAVPMYGAFDFVDRHGVRGRAEMRPFLERMVMPSKLADDPTGWDEVSPMTLARPDAPPFLIVGAADDLLVPIEETRHFVEAMRATSSAAVGYVELPHAQHAFDIINSQRTARVAHAIGEFCDHVVGDRQTA